MTTTENNASYTMPTTDGFSMENHVPLKNFHLLAKGMDKPIQVSEFHHLHGVEYFAEIPKKYLGVDDRFQRPLEAKRVRLMRREWAKQVYKPASVVECYNAEDGKYYYSLTDGQHRAAAYPEDPNVDKTSKDYKPEDQTVFVQLIKNMSPVGSFVHSNDKRTTKALSNDESFWAVRMGQLLGEKGGQFDIYLYVEDCISIIKANGWNPMRYSANSQDAGTHTSAIHKYWSTYAIPRIIKKHKKELEDSDDHVRANAEATVHFEATKVLKDTFALMSVLLNLDSDDFSKERFGGEFWAGMIDFLCNPDFMDLNYDIGLLKRCFSHRSWKEELGSRSSKINKLTCLNSFELGRATFVNKTFLNKNNKERSLNRTHLQNRQLVYHVYHTGMSLEGKTAAVKRQFRLHS